jgi:NAD(P)-dependent dehydrogenase (short-subunit alcohol dehydrogenase family)
VNAALDALGRALACDLGPRLRANTLSPGLVDTEIWDGMPAGVMVWCDGSGVEGWVGSKIWPGGRR